MPERVRTGDVDAIGLAVLASLLAGPVPAELSRAAWPARRPRAALVLWQAIGLAGGLAMIGALLSGALAPLASHLPAALDAAARGGVRRLSTPRLALLAAGVALTLWLLAVLAASFARVGRDRRRHRLALDLIARHDVGHRLLVLEHPVAVAYCVPGVRPRVVVSRATLDLLDAAELAAVIAHERAHVRGRHDLVVQPFVAWQHTFPFLPPARGAPRSVALLVEMLADDVAARATSPGSVASALVRLGASRAGADTADAPGTLGAASETAAVVTRVRRLLTPPPPLPTWISALIYAASAALLIAPTVLLVRG